MSCVEPITTSGYDYTILGERYFKAIRLPDGAVEWHEPVGSTVSGILVIDAEYSPFRLKDELDWVSKIREVWSAQLIDEPVDNSEPWSNPLDSMTTLAVAEAALDALEDDLSACTDEAGGQEKAWASHDLLSKYEGTSNVVDRAVARRLKSRALQRVLATAGCDLDGRVGTSGTGC